MKQLTKDQIVEAVRDMMQSQYGYKCEGGRRYEGHEDKAPSTRSTYAFAQETPTGQAAFSQKTVRVWIEFPSDFDTADIESCSVHIRYEHINRGGNGYGREYSAMKERGKYGSEESVIVELVDSDTVRRVQSALHEARYEEVKE